MKKIIKQDKLITFEEFAELIETYKNIFVKEKNILDKNNNYDKLKKIYENIEKENIELLKLRNQFNEKEIFEKYIIV